MSEPNASGTIEVRYRKKDDSYCWIEITIVNLLHDPDICGLLGNYHDISERKKAENALQKSESLFRKMNENSPLGMHFYMINDKNQLIFEDANPSASRLLKVDNSIFIGKTIENAFPPLIQTEVPARYRNAAEKGIPWMTEQIAYNDKQISGAFEVTAFQTAPGKMVAIFTDITDRKKAELAIKESNDYNRQLFSSSKIGLALAKMTGELVDINQAYADIIGYTIEETLQLSYWDITPEKYVEIEQEQLKSLSDKGYFGPFEKEYIHKNGVLVPVVLSGNIIERNGEKFIWSSVGDISERKKNEANFKKLYTAINNSKASIVITDIDGNIEYANPFFTKLTGYSKDEYLGKNQNILKSGIHTDEFYKVMWDTIRSGNTWEGEFCNRKKSGELYWVKSIITPIKNEKEEIVNFIAVKSDISNEKKHEYLVDITLEIFEKSEHLSIAEILYHSIELGIKLTDSEIGFFHFVNEDQETISLQAWSAKTMDICNVPTLDKHYPISKAGVWVDCFYQKKPVFHNDYSSLSHKKGLPEGHATLTRDLAVPVIIENKVVAIFGVGNKKFDYNKIDAEFLSIFAGNVWNIATRKKSEIELIDSKDQIHRYASHLQNVREEEKISIAREIHDDLGQILMALQIDMGLLKKNVVKTISLEESTEILPKVDDIVALIKRSIKTARSIMNDLRPELLELHGLVGAINEYLREFEERYHIRCEFNDDIPDIEMTPQQTLALFRILQEAMNNIVKHAKATLVLIQLQTSDNKVALIITDNGVGFDKNNSGRNDSYGMIGMKERVVLLKGELDITSEIGRGTTVKVEIPY